MKRLLRRQARWVNAAILASAALVTVVVALASDFSDPRILYNGYARLAAVAGLVTLLFTSALVLERKVRTGLQVAIVLSLDFHLLLVAYLSTHPIVLQTLEREWFGAVDSPSDDGVVVSEPFEAEGEATGGKSDLAAPLQRTMPLDTPAAPVQRQEVPVSQVAAHRDGMLRQTASPGETLRQSVLPSPHRAEPSETAMAQWPSGPQFRRQMGQSLPLPPETPGLPEAAPTRADSRPAGPEPGVIAVRRERKPSFQFREEAGPRPGLLEDPAAAPRGAAASSAGARRPLAPVPAGSADRWTRARRPSDLGLPKDVAPPPDVIAPWVPARAMTVASGADGLPLRGITGAPFAAPGSPNLTSGGSPAFWAGPVAPQLIGPWPVGGMSAGPSSETGEGTARALTLGAPSTARRSAAGPLAEADTPTIDIPSMAGSGGSGTGGGGTAPVDVRFSVGLPRRTEGDVRIGSSGPAGVGGAGYAIGGPPAGAALARGEGSPVADPLSASGISSLPGLPGRRRGSPSGLSFADERINPFRLREGEKKLTALVEHGGTEQTEAAVRRGLNWLKDHQHEDGHWSLNRFYRTKGQNLPGQGYADNDSAATGLALLPFLGDGNTHVSGEHQQTVRQAARWLIAHQKSDGDLSVRSGDNSHMYAHAIAAIALCEAYGMSKDPALRGPAQRAVDFILAAQHQSLGGWRYHPQNDSDTSVVGWQVMALKSAQMASLQVPKERFERVHKWLRDVEGSGGERGRFRYQRGRETTPAMTAEGLLCLQYLGVGQDDPRLQAGARYLASHLPRPGSDTSYYWYYGTQVMYHLQGDVWRQWNEALRSVLIASQHTNGELAGTWDPKDQWEQAGGRLYSTALRLLMLEVYYRHLPLYQVLRPEIPDGT